METNKLIYIVIVLQVILIVICCLCFGRMNLGSNMKSNQCGSGMHMMPNGEMMSNGSMVDDCQMMSGKGSGMKGMMMDMTARMEGKKGDELDKVFLEDMIVHHEGAVDMAKLLQKETKRPELQKMAKDIVDVQTKEISMMQTWLKEWFASN